ncbi:MAG: carbon-nitrogen hydrolase family protein [Pseudoruegeria sp.]
MTQVPLPVDPITIACAQAQPVAGDIEKNAARVAYMIKEAAQKGASLVQFPEKFLSGYEPDLIRTDPSRYTVVSGDPRLAPIQAACAQNNVCAVIGAATQLDAHLRVSSIIIDGSGDIRGFYHKQFLFESERDLYQPGETSIILELKGWRFGLAICYDTGFGEHAREAALNGCHVYLASALFSKGNGANERAIWFPARALDNTMFVALSNHVGTTGGWDTCGQSAIWAPDGGSVVTAQAEGNDVITAQLNPTNLLEMRQKETMLADFGDRDPTNMFPAEVIPLGEPCG